jgi:hypothetical protein
MDTSVQILATFADESHLAWRQIHSNRSAAFRKIINVSSFNVLLSGTMFPLGPSTDAKGVLEHCGGPFNDTGKWKPQLAKAFARLIDSNVMDFDCLALRILIAPFLLRRGTASTWQGKYVIKRTVVRPVPFLLLPYPDDFSEKTAMDKSAKAKTSPSKARTETLVVRMERADKQRCFAWTPIYEDVLEATKGLTDHARIKVTQEILKKRLSKTRASGRLKRFIGLVKAIKASGERFVVVSNRIFLLCLAHYVYPYFSA